MRSAALEIAARIVWRIDVRVGDVQLCTHLLVAPAAAAAQEPADATVAPLSRLLAAAVGEVFRGPAGVSLHCAVKYQGPLVAPQPLDLASVVATAPPSAETAGALRAVAEQCATRVAEAGSHAAFHAALDAFVALAHCRGQQDEEANTTMLDRCETAGHGRALLLLLLPVLPVLLCVCCCTLAAWSRRSGDECSVRCAVYYAALLVKRQPVSCAVVRC